MFILITIVLVVAVVVLFFMNSAGKVELIERIEDRNGYEIISQENVEITLSVHNARLSDAMFTPEGHEFVLDTKLGEFELK